MKLLDREIGALAAIDERKRLEALSLVRLGQVYDLGRVLDEAVPVFPGRSFHQTLVTTAHHANGGGLGDNEVNWITEVYSSTSQLGTHLDALSHLQRGGQGFGGVTVDELAGVAGVTRLGAETIPQIVTRGWLVDAAPMEPGEVIGTDLLADIAPEPGDAVLFHTGWGRHWDDPDSYLAGEPGPGMEVADRLARMGVAVTGCDTWSYGPVPAEDPARPFEVP
ncbi:MAG: cyclase family protein, partial [Thermoleophilaceae bacterium]